MLFVETVIDNFEEFEKEITIRNLSPLKTLETYGSKYVTYQLILNELGRDRYRNLVLKENATKYPLNVIYNNFLEYTESGFEYDVENNIINAIDDFMEENCVEDDKE